MAWLYVIAAGLLEIPWVMGLKYADNVWTYALVAAAIALSFFLLLRSYRYLPVSVVYAVFTGIGTLGIVIVEAVVKSEGISFSRLFFILLILTGIIGLKLSGRRN